MHRLKESSLNRPTSAQSGFNAVSNHSKMGANIHKASGNSAHCDNAIASLVASRLFASRPSHVQWPSFLQAFRTFPATIRTVVIWPSVCFKSFLAFSKCGEKIREVPQSSAMTDTSSSVIIKLFRVRIIASLKHRIPSAISACFTSSSIVTMLRRHIIEPFFSDLLAVGRQLTLATHRNSAEIAL